MGDESLGSGVPLDDAGMPTWHNVPLDDVGVPVDADSVPDGQPASGEAPTQTPARRARRALLDDDADGSAPAAAESGVSHGQWASDLSAARDVAAYEAAMAAGAGQTPPNTDYQSTSNGLAIGAAEAPMSDLADSETGHGVESDFAVAPVPTAEIPSGVGNGKQKRPHGRHRRAKIALIVVLCVLLVGSGAIALAYSRLNSRLTNTNVNSMLGTDRPTAIASTAEDNSALDPYDGRPMNILVIGSDSRAGDNSSISNDTDDGQRSDTTFIAHVSADRTRVDVVSIPRDTLITIPQCVFEDGSKVPQDGLTKQKFNSAFAYASSGKGTLASGVACTIRAVEAMSGVRIDGYVVIDFAGFAEIVNAIGGVQMWLPCAVKSPDANNLSLPAGLNDLDGDTATNYARARKGTGLGDGSDLMRIQRQQALFEAIAQKVMGMNALTNAGTLYSFVGSVADAITTDLGSIKDIAGFAYSLRNFSTSNLSFTTIPIADAGDGANVVLVPAKDKPIWTALADDTSVTQAIAAASAPTSSGSGTGGTSSSSAAPSTAASSTSQSSSAASSSAPGAPPGVVSAPLGQC